MVRIERLLHDHILGLVPLRPFYDLEFNLVVLIEALEPLGLNC